MDSTAKKIEQNVDAAGNIVLDTSCPPFDGEPVLIRLSNGWCEAWWEKSDGKPHAWDDDGDRGFKWVCLDDRFDADLDEATHWAELPVIDEVPK